MRILITILTILSLTSYVPGYVELTPEMFGAKGNGVQDDGPALQKMLDSAVKVNAKCKLNGWRYRTTIPLKLKYGNFANYTVRISGAGEFWDTKSLTTLTYEGKSGGALDIQNCKGCVVEGINFVGKYTPPKMDVYTTSWDDYRDTTITDTKFNPHAAIRIDPEQSPSGGGSTGITIRSCSFSYFTGGINVSSSGKTLNAELILIEDCRAENVKYFLSGGQAQEKTNIVRRGGAWGNIHTIFVFNRYGQGHPGDWSVEYFNLAGKNGNLIHRASQNFSSMYFNRCHIELLGSVGYWTGGLRNNDIMQNCRVQLASPSIAKNHITVTGNYVTYFNNVFTYYNNAVPSQPFLFKGENRMLSSNRFETNPIYGLRFNKADTTRGFTIDGGQGMKDVSITNGQALLTEDYTIGQTVVFYASNYDYLGMGQVTQSIKGLATVDKINLPSGKYRYGIYKNTSTPNAE